MLAAQLGAILLAYNSLQGLGSALAAWRERLSRLNARGTF